MNKQEVKKLLKEHGRTWSNFVQYMFGRAHGIDNNGEALYYKHDVEQYLYGDNRP